MTRTISNRKIKLSALCLVLLFTVTTLIGLLAVPHIDSQALTAGVVGKLRFQKIAAGEDFAIGLTYDNELFAWSLLDKSDGKNGGNETNLNTTGQGLPSGRTLGEYYPSTPIKLNLNLTGVSLRATEGGDDLEIINVGETFNADTDNKPGGSRVFIGNEVDSQATDYEAKPDYPIDIAATKTTAAMLTTAGLVYVWGHEEEEPTRDTPVTVGLLRRGVGGYRYISVAHEFLPGLIDYNDFPKMLPLATGGSYVNSFVQRVNYITASEQNYMINCTYFEGSNKTTNFIWGQNVYNQQNTEVYSFNNKSSSNGQEVKADISGAILNYTAYLGDGNVYYFDGSTLKVRGRNFTVGDDVKLIKDSDGGYTLSGIVNPFKTEGFLDGYTLGDDNTPGDRNLTRYAKISSAVTSNFQTIGGITTLDASAVTTKLKNSSNMVETTRADDERELSVNRTVFSASSGFGYALSANRKVYYWGNDGYSRSSTEPATVSDLSGSYVQVVAGKKISGKPILELIEAGSVTHYSFYQDKWNDGSEVEENTEYTLKSDYIDGKTQLSAALTLEGEVTVFGTLNGVKVPATVITDVLNKVGAYRNGNSKVEVLFGGYGNHLFAITTFGKMIHITCDNTTGTEATFSASIYYNFSQINANTVAPINNWSLNTTRTTVTFNQGYYNGGKPDASAIIAMYANKTVPTVESNSEHIEMSAATVVNAAASYSGDVYRMILPIEQMEKGYLSITPYDNEADFLAGEESPDIELLKVDKKLTAICGATPDNFGLTFYWSDDRTFSYPIPEEVAFRYVGINYAYIAPRDPASDIGGVENTEDENAPSIRFVITPRKATPTGKSLVIRYWVGRYDSIYSTFRLQGDYDGAKSEPEESRIEKTAATFAFYDFMQASVNVTIQDTPFELTFTSERDPGTDNNSAIPLLDPNNPYNKYYTLTAMNVSKGFDEAINKLSTLLGGEFDAVAAKAALIENLTKADRGFPAKSKITNGNLLYYNALAAKEYNDVYKYLGADHDGNVLTIDPAVMANAGYANYFNYTVNNAFSVFMPFGTISDYEDKIEELKNWFETNVDSANRGIIWFNNEYGLTMKIDEDDEGNPGITFTYSIITIEAVGSMPNNFVDYESAEGTNKLDISRPKTTVTGVHGINVLRVSILDNQNGRRDELNNNSINRALEVFTQSSIVLKTSPTEDSFARGDNEYSGMPGGKQVYVNRTINLALGVAPATPEGGINTARYTIYVRDYFVDTANQNIRISHNGVTGNSAFNAIRNKFLSGTLGNSIEAEDVTADHITIIAKAPVTNFEFNLELRRFAPGSSEFSFSYGENEAEVFYINFKVTVSFDPNVSFSKRSNPTEVGTINEITTVAISSRMNVTEDILKNYATVIVDVGQRDKENILEARWSDDKLGIVLTPKSSGTATVHYTIYLYSFQVSDSFTVTVSTLSALRTVKIIDSETLKLGEMTTYLIRVNNLTDETLELDNYESGVPYTFETTEGTSDVDAENEWTPIDVSEIPFLKEVYVEKDSHIGIRVRSFDSSTVQPTVRMLVKFRSTSTGRIYRVAYRIEPSVQTLQDAATGKTLTIIIDKGARTVSLSGHTEGEQDARTNGIARDENGRYKIPLNFLIGMMNNKSNGNYEIISVQAASDDGVDKYSKYVEAVPEAPLSAQALFITPLYPTQERGTNSINIRVSVVDDSATVTVLNFLVTVTGIKTTLEKEEYTTIILATFFSVLFVLLVIFFIRMGIYWKKRADQRRIVKRNQMLIKMRDKMHNKSDAVNKEQLVKTKLKMEDPKYARMFNEMRQQKEAQEGISLDGSIVAQKADTTEKGKKKKKKKGGNKSLAELKAELEAKREAVAQMQNDAFPDMNAAEVPPMDVPPMDVPPMDVPPMDTPMDQTVMPDMGFGMGGDEFMQPQGDEFMQPQGMEDVIIEPMGSDNNEG